MELVVSGAAAPNAIDVPRTEQQLRRDAKFGRGCSVGLFGGAGRDRTSDPGIMSPLL